MKKLSIENYIRIAMCIFLLYFVVFIQIPFVRKQQKDLEIQKKQYEIQKIQFERYHIKHQKEMKRLDSISLILSQ